MDSYTHFPSHSLFFDCILDIDQIETILLKKTFLLKKMISLTHLPSYSLLSTPCIILMY